MMLRDLEIKREREQTILQELHAVRKLTFESINLFHFFFQQTDVKIELWCLDGEIFNHRHFIQNIRNGLGHKIYVHIQIQLLWTLTHVFVLFVRIHHKRFDFSFLFHRLTWNDARRRSGIYIYRERETERRGCINEWRGKKGNYKIVFPKSIRSTFYRNLVLHLLLHETVAKMILLLLNILTIFQDSFVIISFVENHLCLLLYEIRRYINLLVNTVSFNNENGMIGSERILNSFFFLPN